MIEIIPFTKDWIPQAAALFVQNLKMLRQEVPPLPAGMEDPECVIKKLDWITGAFAGLAAVENGKLSGYLLWLYAENFRGAQWKGAYIPEWAHAVVESSKMNIYRALYRQAAEQWARAGCQMHAITVLASDSLAEKSWYWNGFGLLVVDAIRWAEPLPVQPACPLTIRKAAPEDAAHFCQLDIEHCHHYTQSPVFMASPTPMTPEQFQAFVAQPENAIWMAFDGESPAGFIRCDGYECDGVSLAESEDAFGITGAYVRPAYRGKHAAPALLDAALRDYQSRGKVRCSVNFESFNPEAASFWVKYFTPICYSLMRVPETTR